MNKMKTVYGHTIHNKNEEPTSRIMVLLVCFVIALIIISVCSKSSFLYPLNDWVDANCFFTVGKSIQSGLLPYRDLYEQKGPLLYFLYSLASTISYDTFIGVYLLEIVCCTFFLYFSYKIMELYCYKYALYYLPLLAVAVYTSRSFVHGGSVEELSFPFLTASFYIFLKATKQNSCPTNRESFLIGFLSACVFWMKYSLTGMYVGWFLVFACSLIFRKKIKFLGKTILFIIIGLIVGTLPYILFFGLHRSIHYLIDVYIYDSIFKYAKTNAKSNAIVNLAFNFYGGLQNLIYNWAVIILILIGGIYCIFRKWRTELLYVGSMLVTTFVFCYISGRFYMYYSLVFAPFACLGLIPICLFVTKKINKQFFTRCLFFGYAFLIAAAIYLTPNRYLMLVDKNDLPQYQFANIIEKTPNSTLLNYGFLDGGFYTTTGTIPNCRAFCKLNIPIDELKELQDSYVRDGICDYVVTRDKKLTDNDPNKLYMLIDVSQYYFEGNIHTYYLYSRNLEHL